MIDAPMLQPLMPCNMKSTFDWLISISAPGRVFSLSLRNIPNLKSFSGIRRCIAYIRRISKLASYLLKSKRAIYSKNLVLKLK